MIRTPPEHNTKNPPGQILNTIDNRSPEQRAWDKLADGCCHRTVVERCKDCSHRTLVDRCEDWRIKPRKGLYLRDVIKRIQGEEEPMKLPTPIAGPAKALADLKRALLDACDVVEADSAEQCSIWGRAGRTPELRTALIRRIIKENT